MYNHSDFGKSFKIVITEEPDKEIKDKFFNDLSSIDKQLIEYYKSINSPDEKYFNLYSEDNLIGYSRLIFQLEYAVLSEIYVLNDYRELGLGTFMLNSIRSYLDELNIKLISMGSNKLRLVTHLNYNNDHHEYFISSIKSL